MSTSNGKFSDTGQRSGNGGGFPWFPVLTVVGVAAAAFLLMRRMHGGQESGISMAHMLDQCESAATTLKDRLNLFESDLLAG